MLRMVVAVVGVASSATAFSPRLVPALASSLRSGSRSGGVSPLPAHVIDLDDANYQDTLLGGEKAVLVDACAVWCGPCKLIEPIVHKCGDRWKDQLDVMRYDVESKNSIEVKMEFLRQDVLPQKLPSLILFVDGKAVAKHCGIINEEKLNELISDNISGKSRNGEAEIVGATKEQTKGFISLGVGVGQDDYMLSGLP